MIDGPHELAGGLEVTRPDAFTGDDVGLAQHVRVVYPDLDVFDGLQAPCGHGGSAATRLAKPHRQFTRSTCVLFA